MVWLLMYSSQLSLVAARMKNLRLREVSVKKMRLEESMK